MAQHGWTQIEVPEGWTQIISGRRPPAKWPLQHQKKGLVQSKPHPLGPALVEAIRTAKAEVLESVHPQQKVAEAAARVGRLEAVCALLGEDDPDAEPLEVVRKQARMHARVRLVGERLDPCVQCVTREKKQLARAEAQVREGREVQWRRKLASGLRDWRPSEQRRRNTHELVQSQALHAKKWSWIPTRSIRLRGQLAELQSGRHAIQEAESSRSKKARTLASVSTDVVLFPGGHTTVQSPCPI